MLEREKIAADDTVPSFVGREKKLKQSEAREAEEGQV